ncbi:hypothetical protein PFISCL1PPCAC_23959 [Pristionchus fissidentatus]|uniref:F-box domain-containing protein n=1 Tax=Pristionchus fissidentatus TaxID=1538716 RepID=A0AAV5WL31_9BILA|nr:hypothetical protein PFISCL1PPCAC_23959 [Pristionchus fissidentatus]
MNPDPPPSLGTVNVLCSAVHLKLDDDRIIPARIFSLRGQLAYWLPERNEKASLCLFNETTKEWTRTGVILNGMVAMCIHSSTYCAYTSFVARSILVFTTRTVICRLSIGDDEEIVKNDFRFKNRFTQAVETSADDWDDLQQDYYQADGPVLFALRSGTSELFLLDTRPGGTGVEKRLTVLPSGMQLMFAYDQRLYLLDPNIRCDKSGLSRLMLYNARRDELRAYPCEKDLSHGYPKMPRVEGRERWFHVEDSTFAYFLCRDCYLWRLSLDSHEWLRLHPRVDSIIRPDSARLISVSKNGIAIIGADDRFLSISVTPRTPLAQIRHRSMRWSEQASTDEEASVRTLCRLTNLRTVFPSWTMILDGLPIDRTRVFSIGGVMCYWERGFSLGLLRRPRFTLCYRREIDREWKRTNIVLYGSTPRVVPVDFNNSFIFFDRFLCRRIVWRSVARLRWLEDVQKVRLMGKWYVRGRHGNGQIVWDSDSRFSNSTAGKLVTMQPMSAKLRVVDPKKRREHRILLLRERWLLRFAHKKSLYFVNETVLRSIEGITSLVALDTKAKERRAISCAPDALHGFPVVGTSLDEWTADRTRNVIYTVDRESHIWRLDLFTFSWLRVDPQLPGTDPDSLVQFTRILSISRTGELVVIVNDHVVRAGVDALQFSSRSGASAI